MELFENSTKQKWIQKRSRLEKHFILVSSIMAIVIILLILGLIFQSSGNSNTQQQKFCLTPECVRAAATVLDNLDTKIDPCHDFYRFACGKFINSSLIPMGEGKIHRLDIILYETRKQFYTILAMPIKEHEIKPLTLAKKYFQACMNKYLNKEQDLKYLLDLYETLGGWPVLKQSSWNEEQFEWTNFTYGLRRLGLSTKSLFELVVEKDVVNSSVNVVQLLPPESDVHIGGTIAKANFQLNVNVAVSLGANQTRANEELLESFEFEQELAKNLDKQSSIVPFRQMSISELKVEFPKIPWLELINNILLTDVLLTDSDIVVVQEPLYFAAFEKLITETPKRVLANYAFRKINEELYDSLWPNVIQRLIESEHFELWMDCTTETYQRFKLILSSVHIRTYFENDSKKGVLEMVGYIRNEFKEILKHTDWLDDAVLLNKLDKMRYYIGYPDELLDDKILENYYDKLEILADQYLKSYLNIQIHQANFENSRLHKLVNKDDWTKIGKLVYRSAAYRPFDNFVFIPALMLQSVFYNKDRPRYMNYGAIGYSIGHETTHGFDPDGRKIDENGNLFTWRNPETEKLYLDKMKCIIYQYGNYTVPEINANINGILTLNENIADNGGLKLAYLGYNSWLKQNKEELKLPGLEEFTPHQMFWISSAMVTCVNYRTDYFKIPQPHSPAEFRVLGPFSNSVEFAKDFNCPSGSRMNPVQKCAVL